MHHEWRPPRVTRQPVPSDPPAGPRTRPRPDARRQPVRDLDKERIPRGVTEPVVDVLEVVEIQHQHRIATDTSGESLVRMLEAIPEQRSIRQAGEGVMERLVLELALQPDTVGDIAGADDHGGDTIKDRLASVHLDVEHAPALG